MWFQHLASRFTELASFSVVARMPLLTSFRSTHVPAGCAWLQRKPHCSDMSAVASSQNRQQDATGPQHGPVRLCAWLTGKQ